MVVPLQNFREHWEGYRRSQYPDRQYARKQLCKPRMYRCNALRVHDESRNQREGGYCDRHVAGKAGLIEKLLIEGRLQGSPGIPHYVLQTLILFQSQQFPDLSVALPSDADVFLVKQAFGRMPIESEAFWNNPQI